MLLKLVEHLFRVSALFILSGHQQLQERLKGIGIASHNRSNI